MNALLKNAPTSFPWAFIADHIVICYDISLWPVWVSCASCVPSQHLAHSWATGWRHSLDSVWALLSHSPKHWCFVNTVLGTNTKHSTIEAAVGKINSIPDRPNTGPNFRFLEGYFYLLGHLPSLLYSRFTRQKVKHSLALPLGDIETVINSCFKYTLLSRLCFYCLFCLY